MTTIGDDLIVGASNAYARIGFGPGPGEAYRIDPRNGEWLATYSNPTPADGELFGFAVGAYGDSVFISTPRDALGVASHEYGVVHQFDRETGALIRAIQNPQPVRNESFGTSIAVFDNTLAVGAPHAGAAGHVYLFNRTTGSLQRTLSRPGGDVIQTEFGSDVLKVGNYIAVGTPAESLNATRDGAVYLYDAETGDFMRTIANPSPSIGGRFGATLAAHGDSLFIGHYSGGRIDQFDVESGQLVRTFMRPPGDQQSGFGTKFAVNGKYLASIGSTFTQYAQIFDIETGEFIAQFNDPFVSVGGTGFDDNLIAIGEDFLIVSESHRYLSLIEGPRNSPRETVVGSSFNEPAVGSRNYLPGANGQEIGFQTTLVSTPGSSPQLGVAAEGENRQLTHQSVNAVTTFDVVDLDGWHDATISVDLRISSTGFENGDVLDIYATNGIERTELYREVGDDGVRNDMFESAAGHGFVKYSADVPGHWADVRLVIESTTNSSSGAERFDFDNVQVLASAAIVPEPSTRVIVLSCLAAFPMIRRARAFVRKAIA